MELSLLIELCGFLFFDIVLCLLSITMPPLHCWFWFLDMNHIPNDPTPTCNFQADVLEYYDQTVNSPGGSFYIPAVLRVWYYQGASV